MTYSHFILGFLTAFGVVLLATPSLIKVAKLKHLVDEPSEARKSHQRSVPTIGGIMIFSAFLFACFLWYPYIGMVIDYTSPFLYLMASLVLLFFVGIKDDIIGMSPTKKLIAHLIVGFILVAMAEIEITSFHGLFALDVNFPNYAKLLISIFIYIVIVNSINLIDGVDGLASGIGFIASMVFGFWFYHAGYPNWTLVSFSLAGSLLGFLVFNFNPARIFMGDSGSLIIGAILSVLAIEMIETDPKFLMSPFENVSTPVLAMSVLAYPLLDTLRVFFLRIIHGKSPFTADRNHLHHKLQDKGFGHKKVVLTIFSFNISIICMALFLPIENSTILFLVCATYAKLFVVFCIYPKRIKASK